MARTKFFRVAVEGATATDGRTIERQMLLDAVANFNRETYGVRINLEHIRGLSADGPFKAYGDVLGVKAEEIELSIGGKTEKRLALFAEIDPTDELVAINKKRQKIYTSIEIAPNFAGTNKFGLVGLAATDNPASLGTEMLQFSAAKPLFDSRKQAPDNIFSAAEETTFELIAAPEGGDPATGAFASVKAFFDGLMAGSKPPVDQGQDPGEKPKPANDNAVMDAVLQGFSKMSDAMTTFTRKIEGDLATTRADFAALKAKVENTDANRNDRRPPAAGGNGNFTATDC